MTYLNSEHRPGIHQDGSSEGTDQCSSKAPVPQIHAVGRLLLQAGKQDMHGHCPWHWLWHPRQATSGLKAQRVAPYSPALTCLYPTAVTHTTASTQALRGGGGGGGGGSNAHLLAVSITQTL